MNGKPTDDEYMSFEDFIELIEDAIYPYKLNDSGKSSAANLFHKYSGTLLTECIEIGTKQYLSYDADNAPTRESVEAFLSKLGGIAYNKSRTPIKQEIQHIKAVGRKAYMYWNDSESDNILDDYIKALSGVGWAEDQIIKDLREEVFSLINRMKNWTEWSGAMHGWIHDIKGWSTEDYESISQEGTIIPNTITNGLPKPIQTLAWQVNASFENNLFDCCAVVMRRLMEVLLILTYQNHGIESEIMDNSRNRHIPLEKIINNATQNSTLALSTNTRNDMNLFRDLGNYSAHKIWYNCTRQDIQSKAMKYRVLIEELIYKAGFKK